MEYRYINQETIDSGGRNITSPEMFEEARKYNAEAVKNQNRREKARKLFNAWIVVQFFLLFFRYFTKYNFCITLANPEVSCSK